MAVRSWEPVKEMIGQDCLQKTGKAQELALYLIPIMGRIGKRPTAVGTEFPCREALSQMTISCVTEIPPSALKADVERLKSSE